MGIWKRTHTQAAPRTCVSFSDLFRAELECLQSADGGQPSDVHFDSSDVPFEEGKGSDEPQVRFSREPLVGLALSGGGIRSATFGLGLLKGLDDYEILKSVSYLSTVSGGGYIGGWLSAWHSRNQSTSKFSELNFPPAKELLEPDAPAKELLDPVAPAKELPEPDAVRRLRAFSSFLVPRLGVAQMQLWEGLISLIGGILISLVAANCVFVCALSGWLLLLQAMYSHASWIIMMILTFGALCVFEYYWHRRPSEDRNKYWPLHMLAYALIGGLASALAWKNRGSFGCPTTYDVLTWPSPLDDLSGLFPAFVWLAGALVLLFIRFVRSRVGDSKRWIELGREYNRATACLLLLSLGWTLLASIWWTGRYYTAVLPVGWLPQLVGASSGFALSIGLLNRWFARTPSQVQFGRLTPKLKALTVQLLAYLLLFGAASLVSVEIDAVAAFLKPDILRDVPFEMSPDRASIVELTWLFVFGVALLAAIGVGYNPEQMGLHRFYKDRIVRAFLGASNKAADPYQVDVHPFDDLCINKLAGRPIHLVCCTANGLNDDPLATLGRGGRSAVASNVGFSVGNTAVCWKNPTDPQPLTDKGHVPTLGSFLTASAAALNPLMGSVSMRLGRASMFMLAALNMRLGLWVRHPECGGPSPDSPPFPGRLYFCEMFGFARTRASDATPIGDSVRQLGALWSTVRRRLSVWFTGVTEMTTGSSTNRDVRNDTENESEPPQTPSSRRRSFLHLSDGGHFDNTALYELVRRHCRYIIMSDCGEDPDVAFDDFGNAMRRIREDFGIEIEINLDPLKPGTDGYSKEHMVVGTIHYDAKRGDLGTLLYFKPSLTGDEPYDLYQYAARNKQFPHESTGDQFYDEAQWEAYRRLGEHVVRSGLSFYDNKKRIKTGDESNDARSHQMDKLFASARTYRYPTPPDFPRNFSKLTQQYAEFEGELRKASSTLVREIFPELKESSGTAASNEAQATTPRSDNKAELSSTSPQPEVVPEVAQVEAANGSRTEELGDATTTPEASLRGWENTLHLLLQMTQLMEDVWVNASLDTHASHPLNVGWTNLFMRWASTPQFQLWWPILKPLYGIGFREWVDEAIDRLRLRQSRFRVKSFVHVPFKEKKVDPKSEGAASSVGFRREPTCEPEPPLGGYLYTVRSEHGSHWLDIQAAEVFYWRDNDDIAYWNSDDFHVSAGLWGTGIGSAFLKRVVEDLINEQHMRACHVLLPAFNVADPNIRMVRTDLIAFYSKHGFRSQKPEDIPKKFRDAKFESVLVRNAPVPRGWGLLNNPNASGRTPESGS